LRASALIGNRKFIPNTFVFACAAGSDSDSRASSYKKTQYRQDDQAMCNLTQHLILPSSPEGEAHDLPKLTAGQCYF
jgi:hypothetical protein